MTKRIETNKAIEVKAQEATPKDRRGKLKHVDIRAIKSHYALRLNAESNDILKDKKFKVLMESIRVEGIISPIVVRKNRRFGPMVLIDGERRLLAAQELGMTFVPVVIHYDEDNTTGEILRIIANTNQKKLTPIELGLAYKRLLERGAYSSKRKLADALGVSESTVGDRVNNLKLDKRIIKDLVENNSISDQKVLKAIRTIEKIDEEGKSDKQFGLYNYIVENELTRTQALEHIKQDREIKEVHNFITETIKDKLEIKVNTEGLSEDKVLEIESLIAQIKELSLSDVA